MTRQVIGHRVPVGRTSPAAGDIGGECGRMSANVGAAQPTQNEIIMRSSAVNASSSSHDSSPAARSSAPVKLANPSVAAPQTSHEHADQGATLAAPILTTRLACALAEVALAAPVNDSIEIAGPERASLARSVGAWLEHRNDVLETVIEPLAPCFGAPMDDHERHQPLAKRGARHRKVKDRHGHGIADRGTARQVEGQAFIGASEEQSRESVRGCERRAMEVLCAPLRCPPVQRVDVDQRVTFNAPRPARLPAAAS